MESSITWGKILTWIIASWTRKSKGSKNYRNKSATILKKSLISWPVSSNCHRRWPQWSKKPWSKQNDLQRWFFFIKLHYYFHRLLLFNYIILQEETDELSNQMNCFRRITVNFNFSSFWRLFRARWFFLQRLFLKDHAIYKISKRFMTRVFKQANFNKKSWARRLHLELGVFGLARNIFSFRQLPWFLEVWKF